MYLITGGCSYFGHSCFGGFGKRSGGALETMTPREQEKPSAQNLLLYLIYLLREDKNAELASAEMTPLDGHQSAYLQLPTNHYFNLQEDVSSCR